MRWHTKRLVGALILVGLCFAPHAALAQHQKTQVQKRELAKKNGVGLSLDALPGLYRVGIAKDQDRGLGLAGMVGFGYTEGVLDDNDSHNRFLGRTSLSVRPLRWLSFAATVDGRFDKHSSDTGSDDGLVGDPRLRVRAGSEVADGLSIGAQFGVLLPGAVAPSIELSATTLEALLLGSYEFGDSGLSLALQTGFRLDNSADSAKNADQLSRADRLSLGVSDFNAALVGLGLLWQLGDFELLGEWTWEPLLGSGAPPMSKAPMRINAGGRWQPSRSLPLALHLIGEFVPSSRPTVDVGEPLIPVEPLFTVMAGASYLFSFEDEPHIVETPKQQEEVKPEKKEPAKPTTGIATGRITDKVGNGLQATITWKQGQSEGQIVTNADGSFTQAELPQGALELSIAAEGYRPATQSLNIVAGKSVKVSVTLDEDLPVGQIRGYIRSYSGIGLRATVRIEPLGTELKADENGSFEIDVPPGDYRVTIEMDGYRDQHRRVRVQEQGVTVLNIDLRESSGAKRRKAR
ncbi:MAG: carboxypeptidase regulatory-like domain-containing protein [Myxococcales bacterium]|nr:MAG: carboxypeptidase regulatory-like domain-containing protein [Myxococcales bacterium]